MRGHPLAFLLSDSAACKVRSADDSRLFSHSVSKGARKWLGADDFGADRSVLSVENFADFQMTRGSSPRALRGAFLKSVNDLARHLCQTDDVWQIPDDGAHLTPDS